MSSCSCAGHWLDTMVLFNCNVLGVPCIGVQARATGSKQVVQKRCNQLRTFSSFWPRSDEENDKRQRIWETAVGQKEAWLAPS